MTRDEMLTRLSGIRIAAQPTVITYDMGLQYEYVTPEGHGEGFGNMGEWPVYRLQGVSIELMKHVQLKVREGTLSVEDLGDTDLRCFYDNVIGSGRPASCIPTICDFFETILSIDQLHEDTLFVLCDAGQWKPSAYFFGTYEDLENAFVDNYVTYIEKWSDMKNEDLELWLERTENELDSIPFVILYNEDAEE